MQPSTEITTKSGFCTFTIISPPFFVIYMDMAFKTPVTTFVILLKKNPINRILTLNRILINTFLKTTYFLKGELF